MKFSEVNPHLRFAQHFNFFRTECIFNVFDNRIIYIESGNLRIRIGDQKYILSQDSLFYCAEGSVYSISSEGTDLCVLNFDLDQNRCDINKSISPVKIESNESRVYLNNHHVSDCEALNSHICVEKAVSYRSQIYEITKEFENKKLYYREKCSGMLKNILTDIARHEVYQDEKTAKALNNVIAYIHANLESELPNKLLANVAGYHEYHLNRLFSRFTGTTLHKYIMETRVEYAKRLLINSDMQLSQIAQKAGFGSNAHFTHNFKKIVGLNPSEYRNYMMK